VTETRDADVRRLDARLRELEAELERRNRAAEGRACEADEARAGSSPWFEEVIAAVWTAF
jgi:hypothetical protein